MPKHTNINTFLEKAKMVHGDLYDYSQVNYSYAKTPIKIICRKHGEFYQIPQIHLAGSGCPNCMADTKRMSQEEFIRRAKEKYGDKYDYSLTNYSGIKSKVKIICPVHGLFEQIAGVHISESSIIGCIKCANDMPNKEMFVKQAKKAHGDRYDYSEVDYKNAKTKVKIICKKHGLFYQTPDSHLNQKAGCPVCQESHGEKYLTLYFERQGIEYIREYPIIDKGEDKRTLRVDFFLPKYNMVIEYQGKQHYEIIEARGGQKKLEYIQKNDKRKRNYCKAKNIRMIEIKYTEDIEKRLKKLKLE